MGIERLRQYDLQRFKIDALAVISEASMVPLCKKYRIDYLEHDNIPLGKKKNAGLHAAFSMPWQYLVELGSDDLLRNELLDVYEPLMRQGVPLLGLNNLLFANSANGQAVYFKADGCFSLGRAMSRAMLEPITGRVEVEALTDIITNGVVISTGKRDYLNPVTARELAAANFCKVVGPFTYHLWADHINRGLDNNSNYLLQANGIVPTVVTTPEAYALDIKGPDNIWPFDATLGAPVNVADFLQHVTAAERNAFFALQKNQATADSKRYRVAAIENEGRGNTVLITGQNRDNQ